MKVIELEYENKHPESICAVALRLKRKSLGQVGSLYAYVISIKKLK